jgi:hypothetical protein
MAIRWPISQQVLDDIRAYGGLDRDGGMFPGRGLAEQPTPAQLFH